MPDFATDLPTYYGTGYDPDPPNMTAIERINRFINPADGTGLGIISTRDTYNGLPRVAAEIIEGLSDMNDAQAERAVTALESIAASLAFVIAAMPKPPEPEAQEGAQTEELIPARAAAPEAPATPPSVLGADQAQTEELIPATPPTDPASA